MESDPASRTLRKHTNVWMTVLALGLLAVGLLACLYVLIGFPAEAPDDRFYHRNSRPCLSRLTPATTAPAAAELCGTGGQCSAGHRANSRGRIAALRRNLRGGSSRAA